MTNGDTTATMQLVTAIIGAILIPILTTLGLLIWKASAIVAELRKDLATFKDAIATVKDLEKDVTTLKGANEAIRSDHRQLRTKQDELEDELGDLKIGFVRAEAKSFHDK